MKNIIVSKATLKDTEVDKLLLDGITKDAQFAKNTKIIDDIIMAVSIPQGIPVIQV